MEFQKNHNLTDGALARIAQGIGEDVDLPEPPKQPEGDTEEDERRADEIIQMIGAEMRGASPTVTQLVLKRLPDYIGVLPTFRGPAKARRGIRRTDADEGWPGGELRLYDYLDPEKGILTEEESTGVEQFLDMYSTVESEGVDGWANAYEGDTWHINAIGEGLKGAGAPFSYVKKLVALLNEIQRAEFLDEDTLANYESTLIKLSHRIIDGLNEYLEELAAT